MKSLARIITLVAVLTAVVSVGLASPISALRPDDTGSPTSSADIQKARACFKKYDGHGTGKGTDGKFTSKLATQYKKDKCDKNKGGNCSLNSSSQGAVVRCTNPDESEGGTSGDSGSGSSSGSGDNLEDPALSAAARCASDACELITNYVNPFIKLMTVLVGIAVAIGIIVGAIQVITSAGDPQKNANGKNHIRNALIALVAYIVLFSFLQWIIPGGIQ